MLDARSRRSPAVTKRLRLERLEARVLLNAHTNSSWYLDQLDGAPVPQFASRVMEFTQGPSAPTGYNTPALALGAPVLGGPAVPNNDSIVSLGQRNDPNGGRIVLAFDRPIEDDPDNPLGVDFVVYGNCFYLAGDPENPFAEPGYIEVAQDTDHDGRHEDETFYRIATTPATYTDGYEGTFRGFADTVAGNGAWSLLLPDDDTVPGISPLSAGGTAVDIANADWGGDTPLTQIDFVRIVDALPDDTDPIVGAVSTEIDAIVDIDPLSTRPLVYDSDWFSFAGTSVGAFHHEQNGTRATADAVGLADDSAVAVIGNIFDSADTDIYSLGTLGAGTPIRAELFGANALGDVTSVPDDINSLDAKITLARFDGSNLVDVAMADNTLGVDPMIDTTLAAGGDYYLIVAPGAAATGGSAEGLYELDLLLQVANIDVPVTVDFGTVVNDGAGGIAGTRTVAISNTGTSDLVVSGLTLSGAGAAAFALDNAPATPFSIAPGAGTTLELTFDPQASQSFGATLNISSNDLDTPVSAIALSGAGEDAALVFETTGGQALSSLDMGQIYNDGAGNLHTSQAFVLHNVSTTQTVTISTASLTNPNFALEASINGTVLAPGESVSATVLFDPAATGTLNANLFVNTSLGGFSLPASGVGLIYALAGLPGGFTSHELLDADEAAGVTGTIQSGLAFSADGATLYFAAGSYGAQDVYSLDVATGTVAPLTTGNAFGSVASIEYDTAGERLLVADNVVFGGGDLYSVPLAGGSPSLLRAGVVPFLDDLLLATDGWLYASSSVAGDGGSVYRINTSTWTASLWATGLSYANGLAPMSDGSVIAGTTATDFASGSVYRLEAALDADHDGVIEVADGEGVLLGTTTNRSGIADVALSDQDEVFVSQFGGTVLRLDALSGTFSTFATTILSGGELAYHNGLGDGGPNTGDFLPSHGTSDGLAADEDILAMAGGPAWGTSQAGVGALQAVTPDTAPGITVSLPAIAFGTVYDDGVGNITRRATVTVENSGTESLSVSNVAMFAGTDSDFQVDKSGMATTLAPGETTTFAVVFDPDYAGPAVPDTVRVTSNAGTATIPVTGTGGTLTGLPAGYENEDVLNAQNAGAVFGQIQPGLVFSPDGGTLYFAAGYWMAMDVYALDMATDGITDLTPGVTPFGSIASLCYDGANDRLLVADNVDYGGGDIKSVSLSTGAVAVELADAVPYVDDLLLAQDGTLYASNADWGDAGGIFKVDLDAGTATPWATGLSFANGLAFLSDGSIVVGTTASDFASGSVYRLTADMDADASGVIEVAAGEGELLATTTNGAGIGDVVVDDQDRVFASQFTGAILAIDDGAFEPFATTPLSTGELAYFNGEDPGNPNAGAFLPYKGTQTGGIGAGEDVLAAAGRVPWDVAPMTNTGAGVIHAINPVAVAQIEVSPESTDFGVVYADGPGNVSRALTVTVSNTGSEVLTIDTVAASDGSQFTLDLSALDYSIAPGESSTFGIVFDPTTTGALSDAVYVISNDPVTPGATISVTGTAADLALAREGFTSEDLITDTNAGGLFGTVQSGLTFSPDGTLLYFAAGFYGSQDVFVLNTATGAVSDVTAATNPFGSVASIVYDSARNRLLVSDNINYGSGRIYTVSLADGSTTLRSTGAVPFIDDLLIGPGGMLYAANSDYGDAGAVYAINMNTWSASVWATGLSFAGGLAKSLDGAVLVGTTASDFASGSIYKLDNTMDTDLDGVIEVADGEGQLLGTLANGAGLLDIAADGEGLIYATQYTGNVAMLIGSQFETLATDALSTGELAFRDVGARRFLPDARLGFGLSDALAIAGAPQFVFDPRQSNAGVGTIHLVEPDLAPAGSDLTLHSGEKYAFVDANGADVEVSIKNADARLILSEDKHTLRSIIMSDHDNKSTLTIKAEAGGADALTPIGAIYGAADGSMGRISAMAVLDGEGLLISEDLGKLDLGTLAEGTAIVVTGEAGKVTLTQGDVHGTMATGAIGSLRVMTGDLAAQVTAAGGIGKVDVRDGDLTGTLSGASIGKVTVRNGQFTGAIEASAGDVGAVTVKGGGEMSGRVSATGEIGKLSFAGPAKDAPVDFTGQIEARGDIRSIALGTRGSFAGAVVRSGGEVGKITALSADEFTLSAVTVRSLSIRYDVTDSRLLAGLDIGADLTLGTADDSLGAGWFRTVKIGGYLRNSSLAAGVSPGADLVFGNGNDVGSGEGGTFLKPVKIGVISISAGKTDGILADTGPFRVKVSGTTVEVTDANGNGNLLPIEKDRFLGGVV